mgnify:CR=1 FL=1
MSGSVATAGDDDAGCTLNFTFRTCFPGRIVGETPDFGAVCVVGRDIGDFGVVCVIPRLVKGSTRSDRKSTRLNSSH